MTSAEPPPLAVVPAVLRTTARDGSAAINTRASKSRVGAVERGPPGGGGAANSNNNTPPTSAKDKGVETRSTSNQCSQCDRRAPCNLHRHLQSGRPPSPSASPAAALSRGPQQQQQQQQHHHHHHHHSQQQQPSHQQQQQNQTQHFTGPGTRPRRISKLRHRALNSTSSSTPADFASSDLSPTSQQHHHGAAPAGSPPSSSPTSTIAATPNPNLAPHPNNPQPSPSRRRSPTLRRSREPMEPPVLSFYGTEPVPLPSRFASIKRSLVAGHEAQLEASWARLLAQLRDEVAHIESLGPSLTPSIEFTEIDDPAKAVPFAAALRRYGVGVVRGAMPRADTQQAIEETVQYLESKHDFKPPPAQDPTCFDFFWSPAQVRSRAHPNVLQTQRFAMGLWDHNEDDRMAIRFPISYADRIRIHGAGVSASNGGSGVSGLADGPGGSAKSGGAKNVLDTANEARPAAVELLGDFSSSTVIAQVDNGSLERWEPDGYGRGGTYEAVFRGEWEKYDPWDPTFRVTATPDLYNGYGACSIFRMYQGILALSTIEPGMVRLLPSPKLATAYFLLRPFFSPKTKPPPEDRREGPEWDAFLDASNWALDKDQSTIIHGAVPGHAQRLTELWHPHLHLRRTLVTLPTLRAGDYILWHPDLAYHFSSGTAGFGPSRAATPPPDAPPQVSMLVYVPACPLTQTNALYLARQRKTFQRGHPGPDFDATGSGLGSEATHAGRPGEKEIEQAGGPSGLQAMGLAPFDVAATPPAPSLAGSTAEERKEPATTTITSSAAAAAAVGSAAAAAGEEDVTMADAEDEAAAEAEAERRSRARRVDTPGSDAAAEVARLANIILFPDRYDFYMSGRRTGTSTPRVPAVEKPAEVAAK